MINAAKKLAERKEQEKKHPSTMTKEPIWGWEKRARTCTKCDISKYCGAKVLYRGYAHRVPIDVLFVGEAPGQAEHAIGLPFVGPAGDEFDNIIDTMPPDISWVVTNSILCTPFEDDTLTPPPRQPYLSEVKECSVHLRSLIEILQPKHVIALGNYGAKALKHIKQEYTLLPHPSAIMQSKHRDLEFHKATLKLMHTLQEDK
jgi:DNA polymerase